MRISDKNREEARKVLGNLTITVSANIGPFGKTKTIDFPQTDEVVGSTAKIIARIRAESKAEVAYGSHVLYKTGDVDAPAQIKDANGDVCLGMCRNCGRAEAELAEVCDHRSVKAEALREAVRAARAWKWPNDGTGRHDLFNRGVEAACAAILADEPRTECAWTFDASTDSWDSSCGEKWAFTSDGPRENGVRYCHRCGKPVRIADVPETPEQAQKAADDRAYKWRHDMMGDDPTEKWE